MAAYLAAGVAVWWHVWSGHPAGTMTCPCGDPAQSLWFMAWVAHAEAHLQDPLVSTAAAHPAGVNLLANQSSVLVGTVLAPVTWLFGPVAALNAALTLAAPVNAVGGAALCRRFAGWGPSAAGGALFGFSPLVLTELQVAHLADTVLVFLPVMAICLHELLVRQRGRPAVWGAGLAAAAAAQFFTSAEMLVAFAVVAVPVSLVVLAARWQSRRRAGRAGAAAAERLHGGAGRARRVTAATLARGAPAGAGSEAVPGPGWSARHAAVGLGVAGAASAVLLAGPAWFALAGPQHITGAVWQGTGDFGAPWTSFFSAPAPGTATLLFTHYAGYLGRPGLPAAYLGPWLLGVLALGVVAARRRPVTWAAVASLLLACVLALGGALLPLGWYSSWWLPWHALARLPVLDDVVPQRLMAVGFLAAGVLLAVSLHAAAGRGAAGGPSPVAGRRRARWRGALACSMVAAALVPVAVGAGAPFTVTAVRVPPWFTRVAPTLGRHAVLLVLPFPSGRVSDAMGWQAVGGFTFAMAGAYAKIPGPGGRVEYGGAPGSAVAVLSQLTEPTGPLPVPTAGAEARVRAALVRWQVTDVVVTGRQLGAIYPARYAVTFMTAVLGRLPSVQAGAWVWHEPSSAPPPLPVDATSMRSCASLASRPAAPMLAGPACIVRSGSRSVTAVVRLR